MSRKHEMNEEHFSHPNTAWKTRPEREKPSVSTYSSPRIAPCTDLMISLVGLRGTYFVGRSHSDPSRKRSTDSFGGHLDVPAQSPRLKDLALSVLPRFLFVLCCVVLFCFVFIFVLFCFALFSFVLFCFAMLCFAMCCFALFCFVLFF